MTSFATRAYHVAGMTCGHCRLSVMEEVGELDGVEQVDVELDSGRLDVTGADFTDDEVRAAVEEAGYEVVIGR